MTVFTSKLLSRDLWKCWSQIIKEWFKIRKVGKLNIFRRQTHFTYFFKISKFSWSFLPLKAPLLCKWLSRPIHVFCLQLIGLGKGCLVKPKSILANQYWEIQIWKLLAIFLYGKLKPLYERYRIFSIFLWEPFIDWKRNLAS